MKTNKITVTITVEVLSTDCIAGLVTKAAEQYTNEFHNGSLTADDGDTVTWKTETKPVEIV